MGKCTIKNGKYYAPNGAESILYKSLREKVSEDEANDLFVLSKTPTFKERVEQKLIDNFRNKILSFPSNVKFKETFINKIRTFHIYDEKIKVGRIQLTPYKDGFKVKSSLINDKQRGKGYGKFLYNYAISKLLVENSTLYTDTARTENADKVWESLKKQGLTEDLKTVKSLPKEFDENGEVKAGVVFKYAEDNFSQVTPLTAVEKSHLINLQIEGVETSTDLYNILYPAFYKNNFFSPNINKLNKIYDENEIRNILESSEIQGRVKETIEKLRYTEEFDIPKVKINKEFEVISDKVNVIGQYKKQNPLKLESQYIQENTDTDIQNPVIDLSDYSRVEVVNENGEQVETQLFYENAIKQPSEESIRALKAVIGAHPMVDTAKLESKAIKSFKDYGMDVEGLKKEDFPKLLEFVTAPTENNRKSLEEALGFISVIDSKVVKGLPKNRTYQYLKTSMSEQELFDELSLVQTSESNVYHKVNKIDEQEMRDIQDNQDLTIPDYQLYKDYYEYDIINTKKEQLRIITNSNPAPNDYNTWIRKVQDIKTAKEAFSEAFDNGAMYPDFTENAMKKALKDGKIIVYSSYSIDNGVFVTPSKMNAQDYAGGGKVYSQSVSINDIAWIDESEGQYVPIKSKKEYIKPKLKKEIQTNVEGDIDYLLNDFIADFAVEKLKNPTEFNRQFKITLEGIELTSNDDITIAIVKSYIQDGGKYTKEIADYSLLSKEMPNLKEKSLDFITSKQDRKIEAINNIDKVAPFKESITILDDDSLYAPGESAEFLKLEDDLYEQQEEGYYTKIDKNDSSTLVEMNVENLKREKFEIQQEKLAENKIKKIISKEAEKENFFCI